MDRNKEIARLAREEELSGKEIGEKFGITPQAVYKALKQMGISKRYAGRKRYGARNGLIKSRIETRYAYIKNNPKLNNTQIAKELGVCYGAILQDRNKMGQKSFTPKDLTRNELKKIIKANVKIDRYTDCWLWLGTFTNDYPAFTVYVCPNGKGTKKERYLRRIITMLWNGYKHIDSQIKNYCDNKECISPEHLYYSGLKKTKTEKS